MTRRRRTQIFAVAGVTALTACTSIEVRTEQACLNPNHSRSEPSSALGRFWAWAFGPACGDSDFYAGLAAYERQDFDTARDIWQRQADNGFARSQFHLAALYGAGWPGVEPDPARAKGLYAAAVVQGYNVGYFNLVRSEETQTAARKSWHSIVAEASQRTAPTSELAAQDVVGPTVETTPSAVAGIPQSKPEVNEFAAATRTEKSGGPSLIVPIPAASPKQARATEPAAPAAPTLASAPNVPVPQAPPPALGGFESGMTSYMRANYRDALQRWTALAETGDARAQTWIGIMHDNGQGVPRDHQKAVGWYRRAADQSYAEAQFSLGTSYDKGLGVREDHRQAAQWYQRAAQQGHTDAQFRLGLMYLNGRGLAPDLRLAYVWFGFAAAAGDTIAQESQDLLALGMTPAEIAEAKVLAASWGRRITAAGPSLTGS